jgi:hypothetical protein
MAQVIRRQQPKPTGLQLHQDETFFAWRFGSPSGRFVFYYHEDRGAATAYAVIRASANNQRGYIVDCAETQHGGLQAILQHVIDVRHFGIVSIYGFCGDGGLRQTLRRLGFRRHRVLRMLDRRLGSEMPVLIRPLPEDYTGDDFTIAGLDLRLVDNWRLKGVCSDGV